MTTVLLVTDSYQGYWFCYEYRMVMSYESPLLLANIFSEKKKDDGLVTCP